ncbi:MAG TPA: hypothetical protein VLL69_09990 [Streptosporangiaceae bacterium]|nr:hypothetical protein [Streptosporangiaceae bacterium]
MLELLLTAGVTTVAEAAFQDKVWRPFDRGRHQRRLPAGLEEIVAFAAASADAPAAHKGIGCERD